MNFGFAPENERFREEVRQFIADNVTPAVREEMQGRREEGPGPLMQELFRKLGAKGWIGMSWPKEYGGQDADRVNQYIFEEELTRAGVNLVINNILEQAPVIMAVGTEEQKKYFIPGLIKGDIRFALGYTEPSAGADLASLKTRAVEDGDYFVINGQKMFTSNAHWVSHIYLMARTDPDAPKHRGISILLVPMNTPGITVRPLLTIAMGRTNEVFFDDVRGPRTALLGEKNQGWYVGSMGLNLGRAGAGRYVGYVSPFEQAVRFVKENQIYGHSLAEDPAIVDKLAEMYCDAQATRMFTMRSLSFSKRGAANPTYEISSEKIWGPDFAIRSTEVINQILGPYGQLWKGSELAPDDGEFARRFLAAMMTSVGHGSVEVMRDAIARRGLGLPRS